MERYGGGEGCREVLELSVEGMRKTFTDPDTLTAYFLTFLAVSTQAKYRASERKGDASRQNLLVGGPLLVMVTSTII